MCTVLLPPGDNPTAVNQYIISYQRSRDLKINPKIKDQAQKAKLFLSTPPWHRGGVGDSSTHSYFGTR